MLIYSKNPFGGDCMDIHTIGRNTFFVCGGAQVEQYNFEYYSVNVNDEFELWIWVVKANV
jgi:hypothetical protein